MQEPRISDKTPMSEEVGTCAIFTSVRYKRHTRGLRPRLTLAIAIRQLCRSLFYAGHDSRVQICIFNRELTCADTTGTVLVPWAGHFKYKIFKKIKYTEAILSNCRTAGNCYVYIRLFHHEGSTKSITDKKYKSDRTRARGM